ncbi:MAG: tetratricopeptide repeat protein [bacterium]
MNLNKLYKLKSYLDNKYFLWPLIIFASAFTFRLLGLLFIKNEFIFQVPMLDSAYYNAWAVEIVKNNDWIGKSAQAVLVSPGYPYFLAVIYSIFGINILPAVMIQCLVSALICCIVYKLGKDLFNRSAGIIAGLILSAYGLDIFYSLFLLKAVYINLFSLLVILSLWVALEKSNLWFVLLAGLLTGLVSQFRPDIMVFCFLFILWVFFFLRERKISFRIKFILVFLTGLVYILVPIYLKNYYVTKEPVIFTSHGGGTFYTGNNSLSPGYFIEMPFAHSDAKYEQLDFMYEASKRLKRRITPNEASSFWFQEGIKYIRNNPFKWLMLEIKKFSLFWNHQEIPINMNYDFFKDKYPVFKILFLHWGIIAPFALIGLYFVFVYRGIKNNGIMLISLFLISNIIIGMVFFVSSEYRYPALPVLILFGGYGIIRIINEFINGNMDKRIKIAICMLVLLVFCNLRIYKDNFSYAYSNLGLLLLEKGQIEEAENEIQKAIELDPNSGFNWMVLGNLYFDKNQKDKALSAYEKSIELTPYADAYSRIGIIYLSEGKKKIAKEVLEKALELAPGHQEARYYYSLTLQKR